MTPLVLASGNPGKLREFAQLLARSPYEVHSQAAFGVPTVAETNGKVSNGKVRKGSGILSLMVLRLCLFFLIPDHQEVFL